MRSNILKSYTQLLNDLDFFLHYENYYVDPELLILKAMLMALQHNFLWQITDLCLISYT